MFCYRVFVIFSPSKNISHAQDLREVAAYVKDEMPIPIKHDIAETL